MLFQPEGLFNFYLTQQFCGTIVLSVIQQTDQIVEDVNLA